MRFKLEASWRATRRVESVIGSRKGDGLGSGRTVAAVTELIKRGLYKDFVEVLDGVVPIRMISEGVIENTGVPLVARGEVDVRKGLPFSISVGDHLEIR